MIKIIFLLLSLTLLSPQQLIHACPIEEQQIVYVINTLPVSSESPMKVRCTFNGQDLGEHVLYHDQDFHFKFCSTNQGRSMSCSVQWGSKKAAFEAFKETGSRGSETFWSARSDGIHLSLDEKIVKWTG